MLGFAPWLGGAPLGVSQGFVVVLADPETMEKHGEAASHGNRRTFLRRLAAALGQGEPEATQIRAPVPMGTGELRRIHSRVIHRPPLATRCR